MDEEVEDDFDTETDYQGFFLSFFLRIITLWQQEEQEGENNIFP